MPVRIQAAEHPILKVFSHDYDFVIPFYQRPYAWTIDQASELLDDLRDNMGQESQPVDEMNPYFLGSVVLVKGDPPRAEVVDGQQRVTTLTILLSVLRPQLAQEEARGITEILYEHANPILGTPSRYRLTLRSQDADFFRSHIQDENGLAELEKLRTVELSDSQAHLRDNTLYYAVQLTKLSPAQRSRLAQFTVRRCYLVLVSTADADSAYRVFSVLNNRGLDLSPTDILKADVVGKIPKADQERYARLWEDLEELVGREPFAELFAHIRMIYRKTKLRDLVAEYKTYILPTLKPDRFISDVLRPLSESYEDIVKATYESTQDAEAVNNVLHWLNRVDNFDWMPPALLFMSRNYGNRGEVLRFLTRLERIAACLMILRRNVNQRIDRYGALLRAIEQGADLHRAGSPLELTADEQREFLLTLDGDIYSQKATRLYILLRLDAQLAHSQARYDHATITVEHVLPQTPTSNSVWLQWFPDPVSRALWTNRLANLVLLTRKKNSQAQNFDFDTKKKRYFTTTAGVSNFALTTQVLQTPNWTPDVLQHRQNTLLNCLQQLWDLHATPGGP